MPKIIYHMSISSEENTDRRILQPDWLGDYGPYLESWFPFLLPKNLEKPSYHHPKAI